MTKKGTIRIGVLSDVHLGHRRTPTIEIIDNIKRLIPDKAETSDYDILFIPGDLFDRHLGLPYDEVMEIHSFLSWLIKLCKQRDIILRVLEGTPEHDCKQSQLIDRINHHIEADAKHVDVLSIEHIEKLGINVLYLPDEWDRDSDNTWMEVKGELSDNNLEKVDYVIMHGMFEYQLPNVPIEKMPSHHKSERYNSIVEHYVFCGHVHTTSKHDKIIVPGSVDRLAHNEEEPKGMYKLTVTADGDDYIEFIENEHAKIYKTVDCVGLDFDAAWGKLEEGLSGIPDGSHVRILVNRDDSIADSIEEIKKKYPFYHWERKLNDSRVKSVDVIEDLKSRYKGTPITPRTLPTLIENKLMDTVDDRNMIKKCMNKLEGFLNEQSGTGSSG